VLRAARGTIIADVQAFKVELRLVNALTALHVDESSLYSALRKGDETARTSLRLPDLHFG
jgi:hypothetical protein